MSPISENISQGFTALQSGHFAQAEQLARSKLQTDSGNTDWKTLLSLSLLAQKKPEQALPLLQELVIAQENVSEHWSNLANCLCELGRETEASEPAAKARALGGGDVALWLASARSSIAMGDVHQAYEFVMAAQGAAPEDVEIAILQTRILLTLDRAENASALLKQIITFPLSGLEWVDAGYLHLRLSEFEQAETAFSHALKDQQSKHDAQVGWGLACERSNRLDQAKQAEAAILSGDISILDTRQQQKLSLLQARLAMRDDAYALASEKISEVLAQPLDDPHLRCSLYFYLGRCHERLKQSDLAMQAFAQGHATRLAHVGKVHPDLIAETDLLRILDRPVPTLAKVDFRVDERTDPVFVVGYPRSGTTLLEQLLDAHAGLGSFDEQPFLQQLINRLEKEVGEYPACLANLGANKILQLRDQYYAAVEGVLSNASSVRAVDKNPLNMSRIPLIRAVFPRAKIILILRHPFDAVLSCYMQDFKAPGFAIAFQTMQSTASMYDRVFSFWQQHIADLNLDVHVLRYEDLVSDFLPTAKSLFSFLQLDWSDELLKFTERAASRGVISTPSYSQVIEPVNTKAVGRWHRYADYFGDDVQQHLLPWCERFNYPV